MITRVTFPKSPSQIEIGTGGQKCRTGARVSRTRSAEAPAMGNTSVAPSSAVATSLQVLGCSCVGPKVPAMFRVISGVDGETAIQHMDSEECQNFGESVDTGCSLGTQSEVNSSAGTWSRKPTPDGDTVLTQSRTGTPPPYLPGELRTHVKADSDEPKTPRTPKRRARKALSVTETMGELQSSALQITIINPGKLSSFYKLSEGNPLGQGSFGVVRKATLLASKAERAVKAIPKSKMKMRMESLKQEMEIMKIVDHPNVVMIYEIFEDLTHLHLVLELCAGGHLHGYIRRHGHVSETLAAVAMQHILRAVYYLHTNCICHRDLKAENVLLASMGHLDEVLLKVSDFGLSCNFTDGQIMRSTVGTASHMAPEVLEKMYDQSCDLWSCGVILYNMLSGVLPFGCEAEVRAGRYSMALKEFCDVSHDVINMLGKLMRRRKAGRLTAPEALRHTWMEKMLQQQCPSVKYGQLLKDLKRYRLYNKLKRATLCAVTGMLDASQVRRWREVFLSLDSDGDGLVCMEELKDRLELSQQAAARKDSAGKPTSGRKPIREYMMSIEDREDLKSAFEEKDATGAFTIQDFNYTEFLAATFDRKYLTVEVCLAAFKSFDKDKDDLISLAELGQGRLLGQLSMEELAQTLRDLDQDGNSSIDFEEFMQMMGS